MSRKHPVEGPKYSTHQRCRCGWRGTDIACVVDEDEAQGLMEYLCPDCGEDTEVMDEQEVWEWEQWQRQVSEAHGILIREWMQQPKPRGKRPSRAEAERRCWYHLTHGGEIP